MRMRHAVITLIVGLAVVVKGQLWGKVETTPFVDEAWAQAPYFAGFVITLLTIRMIGSDRGRKVWLVYRVYRVTDHAVVLESFCLLADSEKRTLLDNHSALLRLLLGG